MSRGALVLVLVLLSGCGQAASSSAATREELVAAANALCDDAAGTVDRVPSGIRTDGSEGPPVSEAELAETADREERLARQARELAGDAREVDGPDEDEQVLDDLAALLDDAAEDLTTAATAARAGQRTEHDTAQRSAYETYLELSSTYERRFGKQCGTRTD